MLTNKAKIISITSVKGGTGKSTLTLNLAGMLSKKNKKTIIIDLDLSSGVIGASLNIKSNKDVYILTDDMMNNRFDDIENYIEKYNENIDVLPAPNDPRTSGKIHYQYIENIIRQFKYKYDVILIDTNHSINSINLSIFDNSDEIIYLFTDALMDLKNMKTMISILDDMNEHKQLLVLNGMLHRYLTDFEVKTILGANIDYILPHSYFEEDIEDYIKDGKIITLEKNKKIDVLDKIVDKILN